MIATNLVRHVRSNAIAYAALFVALGGTSYAAVHIAAHSIGPRQLRSHSIGAAQIKPGSLKAGDFAPDQLPQTTDASYHGELAVPPGGTVEVPLQNASWTQGPNEDELVIPGIQLKLPGTCTAKENTGALVTDVVDGQILATLKGFQSFTSAPAASVQSLPPQDPATLAHTGSPQPHHGTIKVTNGCEGAGQNYVVLSATLDVVSFPAG